MRHRTRAFATSVVVCAGIGFCPALGQSELAKLLPPDGGLEDYFGHAVAISGYTAVIGVQYDDDNAENAGAAHVFVYDGSSWTHQVKLLPDDAAASDKFGASLDIDGDTILIGAPEDDDNGVNSGSAYVFHSDGSNWAQQAKLLPDDGTTDGLFGNSVAISGATALIGVSGNNPVGEYTGSAYVFHFDGANWVQQTKLVASDGGDADLWGVRMALDGDTAVIGAPYDDANGRDSGSVYVFHRNGATWSQQQKISAADGAERDQFGWSVAVSGNLIFAGAPNDGPSDDPWYDSRPGSAYVFAFDGSYWFQQAKLEGSGPGLFGYSVAVDGNQALIGSPLDDVNGPDAGVVYAFRSRHSSWPLTQILTASDAATWDRFGSSVALWGNTALVGAHRNDDSGSNSGSAYVFDPLRCPGDLDGDNQIATSDLLQLLNNYGTPSGMSYEDGDLDADGDVDLRDLAELLGWYGMICG